MKRYRAGSRAELGGGCNSKLTYGLKVVMKLIMFGIVMLLSEKKYASYVHEFHFQRNAIVSSVENSLYAPFQRNTLTVYICHC